MAKVFVGLALIVLAVFVWVFLSISPQGFAGGQGTSVPVLAQSSAKLSLEVLFSGMNVDRATQLTNLRGELETAVGKLRQAVADSDPEGRETLGAAWDKLREQLDLILLQQDFPGYAQEPEPAVRTSADAVAVAAEELTRLANSLAAKKGQAAGGLLSMPTLLMLAGGVLVLMIISGLLLLRKPEVNVQSAKDIESRNQEAIMRLLEEMEGLADGDLTVEAQINGDFTDAIADAINYAVEALRTLVTRINETVGLVSTFAKESQDTAARLTSASDHQVGQIKGLSESIHQMSGSADSMSKEAAQSAEVARRSVEVAANGTASVRNTISGMDGIREQIQDTAKRIKRLGESSQEIGDIVELIDDIADQTNILALNAAMQAAMAGEAGRGFAVVADEVQRLAERSGKATKQIEALVRTIQTDTNEAVSSMETTTSGVVKMASLAEKSGDALGEIETVSKYLAKSTHQIAKVAKIQSAMANEINNGMIEVENISRQTSEGTNQTSLSIGALVEIANQLQSSVDGFRLPD